MVDYDRTRPLLDGTVQIDGVDPVFMTLSPEEMFFRAYRHAEFDISELSFSSFLVKHSRGDCPYTGIPVFLSRAFRHTSIYVRKDRIKKPQDLKGCRIGIPEYQLTAIVWARAILEGDYGINPRDVTWVRGGIDEPGRLEKIRFSLPEGVIVEDVGENDTISDMIHRGDIDGFIAPRPPAGAAAGNPDVDWLFDDPVETAGDYYNRTGIFPIMHIVGIRNRLAEEHPWLPNAVLKAFQKAKDIAVDRLSDTSSTKVTLPFVEERLREARRIMGDDYWSYGVKGNENTLTTFLKHHHSQGLSDRLVPLDELFHPSTYESFKI